MRETHEQVKQVMAGMESAMTGVGNALARNERYQILLFQYLKNEGWDISHVSVKRFNTSRVEFQYGQQMYAIEHAVLNKLENGDGRPTINLQ